MDYNFNSIFKNDLTLEENNIIDNYIDKVYEESKNNSNTLTQLAMQSSSCIFAGRAKARDIASKNFLSNLFNEITGKNRKIRGEIDRDFAVSIEACIKMISKLAEENKLTFDFITSFNVKINRFVEDIDKEINEVYCTIFNLMEKTISTFETMNKVKTVVEILALQKKVDFLNLNGIFYKDLEKSERLLCIISDFFLATRGQYSNNELDLLKSLINDFNIDPDSKMSMELLYMAILNNDNVANKFFESIDKTKMDFISDFEIPLLGSLKKIKKLDTDEKYIVETISNMTGKSIEEIKFDLLMTYAKNDLNMDLSKENSCFDLFMALVSELIDIDLTEVRVEIKEEVKEEKINNTILASIYEELGDSYFSARDLEKSYNNYCLAIENGLESRELYYKICTLIFCNYSSYSQNSILRLPPFHEENIDIYINKKEKSKKVSKLFIDDYIKLKRKVSFLDLAMLSAQMGKSLLGGMPFVLSEAFYKKKLEKIYKDNSIYFSLNFPNRYDEDAYIYMFSKEPQKIEVKCFSVEREIINNYINKFLEFSDNYFDSLLDIGVLYYVLEDYDMALDFFERAIKIDNERIEGFINKAKILGEIDLEKNKTLIEDALHRAIGLNPKLAKDFKKNNVEFVDNITDKLIYMTSFYQFLDKKGF